MANGAIGYPGDMERRDYPAGALPAIPAALRRISWGAVFAGLIVAIMCSLILALLGMAIGLGAVNPAEEANPFSGIGAGAAIWWVASSLISLFAGGWVAARMAGMPRGFDGAVHGVLTWGLVTLLTFYLLGTTVGKLVGGVSSMVGKGMGMAGQGLSSVMPQATDAMQDVLKQQGIDVESIRREVTGTLGGDAAGAAGAEQIATIMKRIVAEHKGVATQADKDAAINVLTSRGKSRAEAAAMVDRWTGTLRQTAGKVSQAKAQAEVKAREWGQAAASGMSKASLWTFIALLLGGFASAFGGRMGIPRDVAETRVRA
jgi:hypothetical protein